LKEKEEIWRRLPKQREKKEQKTDFLQRRTKQKKRLYRSTKKKNTM
jgi:hypothetical protein